MIRIRVRREHVIDRIESSPPKVLRDNRLANTSPVRVSSVSIRGSSAVNQQRPSVRQRDQRRVALAHVKEIEAQLSVVSRTERMKDQQGGE